MTDPHYALATVCVDPTCLGTLEAVSAELARRHPKSTPEQRLDMIFLAGVVRLYREFDLQPPLPQPGEPD